MQLPTKERKKNTHTTTRQTDNTQGTRGVAFAAAYLVPPPLLSFLSPLFPLSSMSGRRKPKSFDSAPKSKKKAAGAKAYTCFVESCTSAFTNASDLAHHYETVFSTNNDVHVAALTAQVRTQRDATRTHHIEQQTLNGDSLVLLMCVLPFCVCVCVCSWILVSLLPVLVTCAAVISLTPASYCSMYSNSPPRHHAACRPWSHARVARCIRHYSSHSYRS